MQQTMGNFFPFGNMEEMGRQHLAMMERALSLFTPFVREQEGQPRGAATPAQQDEMTTLRAEVEFLRTQLARVQAGRECEARTESVQVLPNNSPNRIQLDTKPD
jgi:hypothetical protein